MPKGKKSNGNGHFGANGPNEVVGSLFGDFAAGNVGAIFDGTNAESLLALVRQVCGLGGYLGLTSPADSGVIKLSVRIGDAVGGAWAGNSQQFNEAILVAKRACDKVAAHNGDKPAT